MESTDTAVVLAGGRGSRLRPYTTVLPKPLMPVGERPILEIVVRQLARAGIRRLIFAVGHRNDLIRTFFGHGRRWGTHIEFSIERRALSTIGPLKLIEGWLPRSFLVMNGDLLTDLNYRAFLDGHRRCPEQVSVAVRKRDERIDYGVMEIGDDGRVIGFREKPTLSLWVSMGIYAMDRSILGIVPEDVPFGFDDLMHAMLEHRMPIATVAHEGRWHDIGRPDDFERANEDFAANPEAYLGLQDGHLDDEGVMAEPYRDVSPPVELIGATLDSCGTEMETASV